MSDIQRNESNKLWHRTDRSPRFRAEVFFVPTRVLLIIVSYFCIYIVRGSVAAHLR